MALSTLPRHILTQGTAIRSLMRNLGGSIGISVLVAALGPEHADRAFPAGRTLRPDNPLMQGPFLAAPFSLQHAPGARGAQRRGDTAGGNGGLCHDFKLMMLVVLLSLPLLLLLREAPRPALPRSAPAATPAGGRRLIDRPVTTCAALRLHQAFGCEHCGIRDFVAEGAAGKSRSGA